MLSVKLLFISALLLSPSVLGSKKGRPSPSKKRKKGKGDQCLPAWRKTARATAIKEELRGEYLVCDGEAFFNLNVNGTFFDYPIYLPVSAGINKIEPIDTAPQTNLAIFDATFGPTYGPLYGNGTHQTGFSGKWNFVTKQLVFVPSNDVGDNHGVAKTFVCEKYEDDGYPLGTLACESTFVTIEVEDMPTSEYCIC